MKKLLSACLSLVCVASLNPVRASGASISSESAYRENLESAQWWLRAANAEQAWSVSEGEGVTVAVIDTGVDAEHPDLRGKVIDGWIYSLTSQKYKPSPVSQSNYAGEHGTHVAAIIAGARDGIGITGIAPRARIMPINVQAISTRDVDESLWRVLAESVDLSVNGGAKVINMSLGVDSFSEIPGVSSLCDAIKRATERGTLVVAASGNSGDYGSFDSWPAVCSDAVSVAALDNTLQPTYFSSYGASVFVSAPGAGILSANTTDSALPYIEQSGTSMAAPIVAGVAALMYAKWPNITPSEIKERIAATAKDVHTPGRDVLTGYGAIDAARALDVSAPEVKPQSVLRISGEDEEDWTWVSWRPHMADRKILSYEITYRDAVVLEYLDRVSVSPETLKFRMPKGRWIVSVVAKTETESITSSPLLVLAREPIPVIDVKLRVRLSRLKGDRIRVRWDSHFTNREGVSIDVRVSDASDGTLAYLQGLAPGRRSAVVSVPGAQGYDLQAQVSYNQSEDPDDGGELIYEESSRVSPATAGLRIADVREAGERRVMVTGRFTSRYLKKCGVSACIGREVTVAIKGCGRASGWVTGDGMFYANLPTCRQKTIGVRAWGRTGARADTEGWLYLKKTNYGWILER